MSCSVLDWATKMKERFVGPEKSSIFGIEEKEVSSTNFDVSGFRDSLQDSYRVELAKTRGKTASQLVDEFYRDYSKPSWHPSEAVNWNEFTRAKNKKPRSRREPVTIALNEDEQEKIGENNFVVTSRLGSDNFGSSLVNLWSQDIPLYIAADPILHAWHKSFSLMLQNLEEEYCSEILFLVISSIINALPDISKELENNPAMIDDDNLSNVDIGKVISDVEFFLFVGLRLLDPKSEPEEVPEKNSWEYDSYKRKPKPQQRKYPKVSFCDEKEIEDCVKSIAHCKAPAKVPFAVPLDTKDFSLFRPRGHYTKSTKLRRYFQSMSWCGQIDLSFETPLSDISNFKASCAAVLYFAFQKTEQTELFDSLDNLLTMLVGPPDNMTLNNLKDVMKISSIVKVTDILQKAKLSALVNGILDANYGKQSIVNGIHSVQRGTKSEDLPEIIPKSFTFIGQRFGIDSWVTGTICDPNNPEAIVPSTFDISFAVLNNNSISELLSKRMSAPGKEDYSAKLIALRAAIAQLPKEFWRQSVSTMWLYTLEALSHPPECDACPDFMKTRACAIRDFDSQMASWTELRHDTILYVKQSFSCIPGCDYPAGYVDPRVEFWSRMMDLCTTLSNTLEALKFPQKKDDDDSCEISEHDIQRKTSFLGTFKKIMKELHGIATRETENKNMTRNQHDFLRKTLTRHYKRIGSGSSVVYNGWYTELFFGAEYFESDPLVSDFHTIPPSEDGPGGVMHVATGYCPLMIAAIESGDHKRIYAGPVFERYEFQKPFGTRLTDEEWKASLKVKKDIPEAPEHRKIYQTDSQHLGRNY